MTLPHGSTVRPRALNPPKFTVARQLSPKGRLPAAAHGGGAARQLIADSAAVQRSASTVAGRAFLCAATATTGRFRSEHKVVMRQDFFRERELDVPCTKGVKRETNEKVRERRQKSESECGPNYIHSTLNCKVVRPRHASPHGWMEETVPKSQTRRKRSPDFNSDKLGPVCFEFQSESFDSQCFTALIAHPAKR
jgi:hypothetical protein